MDKALACHASGRGVQLNPSSAICEANMYIIAMYGRQMGHGSQMFIILSTGSSVAEIQNPSEVFNAYCARFFDERLMVGTGNANPTAMASWTSSSIDIGSASTFVSKKGLSSTSSSNLAYLLVTRGPSYI